LKVAAKDTPALAHHVLAHAGARPKNRESDYRGDVVPTRADIAHGGSGRGVQRLGTGGPFVGIEQAVRWRVNLWAGLTGSVPAVEPFLIVTL
jgi:hypothetical protein